LIERAITYDVRARPSTISSTSGSRDLQMVNLGLRVLTKPNASRLAEVYRRLGVDYSERVLPSLIHEVRVSFIACPSLLLRAPVDCTYGVRRMNVDSSHPHDASPTPVSADTEIRHCPI
jgi:hypothetical protein